MPAWMPLREYLAFLDSDDRLDPDYLQVLFQTLEGTDLAVCGIHGLPHPAAIPAEVVSLDVLRHTPSRYAGLLYINYVFNKLYRRDLICRHDIRFPDQMHRGEDAYFVQEYLLQCRTIAVTPACCTGMNSMRAPPCAVSTPQFAATGPADAAPV